MSQERVFFLLLAVMAVGTCVLFRYVKAVDVAVADTRRALSWGQVDKVAMNAEQLARTIQDRTEACVEFGWTLAKAGHVKAAETLFQAAWDARPMNHRPPEALAGLYFSQKRLDGVRRVFSRTSALGIPLSAEGKDMRVSQLIIDRDYAKAFNVLQDLAAERPPDAATLAKMGDLQAWQGHYADATPFYRKALAQKPDDPDLQLALLHSLVWSAMADAHATVQKKLSAR